MAPSVKQFGCNLCEAMCGLDVTVDGGRVLEVRGDPKDVFSAGHLCPKGAALKDLHEDPARLRTPMRRAGDGFVPVGWDEAFDEAEQRLSKVRAQHGRDAVAFYFGNPSAHSHGAALGVQALVAALRSKNIYNPNSQDSNPRLFASLQLYGDALSQPVPDIDRTDYLLILGANPIASNGSMWALGDPRRRLQAVRKRGGRLVLVDPRRTETAALCDEHHFIRPGADAALLLAMLHTMFAEGLVKRPWLDAQADGARRLEEAARPFSPDRVTAAVGIAPETIRRFARELCAAERAAVYGRLGTSQSEFALLASFLIDAVNVVAGHFDRPGGVMFPAPAADLAGLSRLVLPKKHGRWRSRVRGLPEFLHALPTAALAEEIETPGAGQIRALICFAGDPVLSAPDGPGLGRALGKLDFHLAIDFYLNETTRRADLVLPPLHVFETGNFDLLMYPFAVRNFVRHSPAVLPRPANGHENFEILAELALRLTTPRWARGPARRLMRGLPDRVLDLLLERGGTSLRELALHPHGIDRGALVPARHERVRWPEGKVRLAPEVLLADLPRLEAWLDGPRDALVLIGRRHLRSNNSWMHNLHPLVKGPGRAQLLMHPVDGAARSISDGGRAHVSTRVGQIEVEVKLTEDVRPGVVCMPHGFGHATSTLPLATALAAPNVNALTDAQWVEPLLGNSILTGLPVEVRALSSALRSAAEPRQVLMPL